MELEKQIIALVSGNLKEDQKKEILKQIKSDAQLRKAYARIKNAWSLASYDQQIDKFAVEESFVSFKKKIRKSQKMSLLQVLKYAAIVMLFFLLGIASDHYIRPHLETISQTGNDLNEIHVPNGEKAELTLSDGSRVWLNSGTTLRFPQTFDKKSRHVSVDGEAFFEVKKGIVPFVVSSEFGDVRVLGTSFNIRAYEDLNFQTTLVEGKIQFKSGGAEQLLMPGQQLILTADKRMLVREVDTRLAYSWKDGSISFDQEPLGEVVKKLERHFNLQIMLDEKLASIRFTGEVFNESVDEVMQYINKTKPIKYEYDKKERLLKIRMKPY